MKPTLLHRASRFVGNVAGNVVGKLAGALTGRGRSLTAKQPFAATSDSAQHVFVVGTSASGKGVTPTFNPFALADPDVTAEAVLNIMGHTSSFQMGCRLAQSYVFRDTGMRDLLSLWMQMTLSRLSAIGFGNPQMLDILEANTRETKEVQVRGTVTDSAHDKPLEVVLSLMFWQHASPPNQLTLRLATYYRDDNSVVATQVCKADLFDLPLNLTREQAEKRLESGEPDALGKLLLGLVTDALKSRTPQALVKQLPDFCQKLDNALAA